MDFDKLFGSINKDSDASIDFEAIDEGSKNLFRLYSSFVDAGFTPDQAMSIILTVLKGIAIL